MVKKQKWVVNTTRTSEGSDNNMWYDSKVKKRKYKRIKVISHSRLRQQKMLRLRMLFLGFLLVTITSATLYFTNGQLRWGELLTRATTTDVINYTGVYLGSDSNYTTYVPSSFALYEEDSNTFQYLQKVYGVSTSGQDGSNVRTIAISEGNDLLIGYDGQLPYVDSSWLQYAISNDDTNNLTETDYTYQSLSLWASTTVEIPYSDISTALDASTNEDGSIYVYVAASPIANIFNYHEAGNAIFKIVRKDQFPVPAIQLMASSVEMAESGLLESATEAGLTANTAQFATQTYKFTDSSAQIQGATLQYAVSEDFVAYDNRNALNFQEIKVGDTFTAPDGTDSYYYIYTRFLPDDKVNYDTSAITVYKMERKVVNTTTITTSSSGGGTTVDVGDTITFQASGMEDATTMLYLYRIDGQKMNTSVVTSADVTGSPTYTNSASGQEEITYYDNSSEYDYLNYRGNYYRLDAEVTWANDSGTISSTFDVPNSILSDGELIIYAMAVPVEMTNVAIWPELMIPTYVTTYQLKLSSQVQEVTATPGDGTSGVKINDTITLACSDTEATIFYTTSATAPLVEWNGNEVAGSNNMSLKYTEAIVIDDTLYEDGGTLAITAIAVKYDSNGNQLENNSDPVTFLYTFGTLDSVVATITADPATADDNITGITVGEYINLTHDADLTTYADATIFYTTDGTAPIVNDIGGVPTSGSDSTSKYTGAIAVPTSDDLIFTITAVVASSGFANSDIVRFTYQYPDKTTAPYATPGTGTVVSGTSVQLGVAEEGALIYYEITYDGSEPSDPTIASGLYGEGTPILITSNTRIKAMAKGVNGYSAIVEFQYTLAEQLGTPTPSIATGSIVAGGTLLTLSSATEGYIYYTTDGSNPSDADNSAVLIGTSVILNGALGDTIILKACTIDTNKTTSEVGTYSYTISNFEGGVFTDVEVDSTIANGSTIRLYTDVTGGMIYYTTDGTMPSATSTQGTELIATGEANTTFNIKAVAMASGSSQTSTAGSFTYYLMPKLKTANADVPSGAIFTEESSVTLSAELGRIYYTTDGSDPTTSSSLYIDPIQVNKAMTIRTLVVQEDYENSDIREFQYTFADKVATPEASLESGQVNQGEELVITCATSGATIYYTTNGNAPSLDDPDSLFTYKEPIPILSAGTYKFVAVVDGMESSNILTRQLTVREPVVVETEEETTTNIGEDSSTNRLQSRTTFSDTSGPSYEDVVLRNATYGAVVSAEHDVIPDDVILKIERTMVNETANTMLQQRLGSNYALITSYDINLLSNGESVQPNGTIEIGLPIPTEYENTIIYMVYFADDGTMEVYDTRRSNGVAYALVDHLSVYSIVASVNTEEEMDYGFLILIAIISGIALVITGTIIYRRATKRTLDEE